MKRRIKSIVALLQCNMYLTSISSSKALTNSQKSAGLANRRPIMDNSIQIKSTLLLS